MKEDAFRAALDVAKQRLANAEEARENALQRVKASEDEIAQLRRVIVSLAALCGETTDMETIGITEACRTVMRAAANSVTLKEVKTLLTDIGFDLSTQKNADASVQAILNRLVDAKEIQRRSGTGRPTSAQYIGRNSTSWWKEAPGY